MTIQEKHFFNTIPTSYNCGGFALRTFDDYTPYFVWCDPLFSTDYSDKISCEDIDDEEDFDELGACNDINCVIQNMLDDFPNMRQIQSENEAKPHENIVLFRYGDCDFHFVLKQGERYFHKRGPEPVIREMDKDEVYEDHWEGRYDSEIYIFAIDFS